MKIPDIWQSKSAKTKNFALELHSVMSANVKRDVKVQTETGKGKKKKKIRTHNQIKLQFAIFLISESSVDTISESIANQTYEKRLEMKRSAWVGGADESGRICKTKSDLVVKIDEDVRREQQNYYQMRMNYNRK